MPLINYIALGTVPYKNYGTNLFKVNINMVLSLQNLYVNFHVMLLQVISCNHLANDYYQKCKTLNVLAYFPCNFTGDSFKIYFQTFHNIASSLYYNKLLIVVNTLKFSKSLFFIFFANTGSYLNLLYIEVRTHLNFVFSISLRYKMRCNYCL